MIRTTISLFVLSLATAVVANPPANDSVNPMKRGAPAPEGGIAGSSCSCDADLDGDGVIAASDLSVLLGSWGGGGDADLDNDGTVSAADLSMLLGAWGPCLAVANDECSDAIILAGPGAYPFCTLNATTSDFGVANCGQAVTIQNDVWFAYTPEGDGELTLATCGSVGFDTVIAAYTTTIPGLAMCPSSGIGVAVLAGCNDDYPGCANNASRLIIQVTGSQTYYIRLGSYHAFAEGTGTLSVSFKSVGDTCDHGIYFNTPDTSITVTGTTVDNPMSPVSQCGQSDSKAEWISWYCPCGGDAANVTVSTCYPATDFDTVISVWRETFDGGCTAEFIGCNDDSGSVGCQINGLSRKSKLSFSATPGRTYHFRVSGYSASAQGNYQFTIEHECVN
ncbi:MAG: hypothetical protein SGJ11_01530 [Phycisphaerae bacterium]|nr:hypothetical protein [Phycisphaerae bacterium]